MASGLLAVGMITLAVGAVRVPLLEGLREEWRFRKLRSDHPQVRSNYATVLGHMGSRRAASYIVRRSADDEEAFADLQAYFFGLQYCPHPGDPEILIGELNEADRGVRCRAAMALAFPVSSPGNGAVEALRRAQRGPDALLTKVAAQALEIIGRSRPLPPGG
jgi:hypothetical protein